MNLTTLANVRQWASSNATVTTDDALLTRLIGEASRMALNYLDRADIGLTDTSEIISARGQRRLQLRNWPVIGVSEVTVENQIIPLSTQPQNYGYFLEPTYGATAGRPQNIGIRGGGCGGVNGNIGTFPNGQGITAIRGGYGSAGKFPSGIGNVMVAYTYGYCVQGEAQNIGATPYQVTPTQPDGSYASDLGVTFANGTALVSVIANPATGQYVAPTTIGDNPIGYYQFAAADTNKAILLSYNYVPYDLEQAVIEIVVERYRYKSRIGISSSSLGGQETTSYMVKDALTAAIKARLDPYRLVWAG